MSDTISNLLNAIMNDKPTDVKAAFDAAIQDKIAPMVNDMKVDQAQNMFEPAIETEDEPVEAEAETEFDDSIFDDFSDEELEAINNLSDDEWDELISSIDNDTPEETGEENG